MKISIVIYSETGNTQRAAEYIMRGAESVDNTQVRCFNLREEESVDIAFIEESSAVIFGTPTYFANMCWQLKKWFDTNRSINLTGKIGSVFATENSPNGGGAELAIMTTINHLLVKGMLIYSSGAGCGRPFIHIGPTVVRDQMEDRKDICNLFGQRVALKAHELFD